MSFMNVPITEFMVSNKISFSESLGLEHEISVSSIHNLSRDPNLSSEVGSPPSPPISLTGASANGCQSNLLCVVHLCSFMIPASLFYEVNDPLLQVCYKP